MEIKGKSEQSLTTQCYEQILQDIINNNLKPGEKLSIESIKKRFNGGQSPIREALSRLVSSGLVDVQENKGFRVAYVTEAEVRDIYDIFTRIENMALSMAVERGDSSWEASVIAELHKLYLIEKSTHPVSRVVWAKQNYQFHRSLIAGCNSPLLLEIREHVYIRFERYLNLSFQFIKDELHHNHEDHKKLAECVVKRETIVAEKLMTAHINGSREYIIDVLKKNKVI